MRKKPGRAKGEKPMRWDKRARRYVPIESVEPRSGDAHSLPGAPPVPEAPAAGAVYLPPGPRPLFSETAVPPYALKTSTIWTPALDAELARRWGDPQESYSSIAAALGFTRNQVGGRINRLGLPKRGGNEAAVAANKARPTKQIVAQDTVGCRFIAGEPPSLDRRCGKPVAGVGQSYCAKHRAICWQKSRQGETA